MITYERRTKLPVSAAELAAWHDREGCFERLAPPWEQVHLVHRPGPPSAGGRWQLAVRKGPLRFNWLAELSALDGERGFRDTTRQWPLNYWEHTHRFLDRPDGGSELVDALRTAPFGGALAAPLVRQAVAQLFAWRHAVTAADLAQQHRWPAFRGRRVLVSGASGLVGRALLPLLLAAGHEVVTLSRHSGRGRVGWDPAHGRLDPAVVTGFDAVVHLAGEPLAAGRWSAARKERIRQSRSAGTRLLAAALAAADRPPAVLVAASAVGWYGDRGDQELTEQSTPGSGFLAEVCRDWEAACDPAREAGLRVVNLRLGVVLSPAGGALAKMLPAARLGLGGPLGNGRQVVSWIALDDVIGAIYHALADPTLSGPVNLTAPTPVTNREFALRLGQVLRRPAILPAPAAALRLALGEMADLLLGGQRVLPAALQAAGYQFRLPDLEGALRHVLGRRVDT
ncbi:MAG: TIGR01777 family oxidoreductase [Fimbriimonadaceae bacterium]|nr:TIGR01777 family oxidoreductase [Fimbriimonadaceae bacterium]